MDEHISQLSDWTELMRIEEYPPHLTYAQMKHLIGNASKDDSIHQCTKIVGRKRYINLRLLALWMEGKL